MKRFVEGESRNQSTLFPELLDDYVGEDNPVRVIDELDLGGFGFSGVEPHATGLKPCSSGSIKTLMRCRVAKRLSNILSEPSRHGWEQHKP